MQADIPAGRSTASEQLGPGPPLGQVDIFVPGPHQVGTVVWTRCLVGLYTWPALLCGDGVGKVTGKPQEVSSGN